MLLEKNPASKTSDANLKNNPKDKFLDFPNSDYVDVKGVEAKEPLNPFIIRENKVDVSSDFSAESPEYYIDCIHSKEKFLNLKHQWNQLVESSSCQNPFMLWEWMYTWWDVFGSRDNQLYIIAIYEGNSLISIAPFYIKKKFKFSKRLSFIGEGENQADAIVTHYPDIIVSEKHQEIAVSKTVEYLRNSMENKHVFDFARFDLVKQDAVIHKVTKELSQNIETKREHSGNQFIIPLPTDGDEYIASLSKSARKQFRLKHNRLEKAGEFELANENDLSKGLEVVEKLHRSRWEEVVSTSIFDSQLFNSFHSKLCERFAGQDIVDIRTMTLNDSTIVAAYNFKYKKMSYSYLSGFNSEDDNRLSPMFVFDLLELKKLIDEGFHSFDLLVSESENNYKKRFGSNIIPCDKILWIPNSRSSFFFKRYFSIKPHLSNLYKKLKYRK
ncbi:MAG: CelD/BcsL family acetyltransferase involved in cellulose biosynthesis [Cocleimonas sp.]|jgi:CelD/BcsL family acetyltransferase involved in cellulose biosynthesis